jgi:hypothetical protein
MVCKDMMIIKLQLSPKDETTWQKVGIITYFLEIMLFLQTKGRKSYE